MTDYKTVPCEHLIRAAELLEANAQAIRNRHQRFDGEWDKKDADLRSDAEDSEMLVGEFLRAIAVAPAPSGEAVCGDCGGDGFTVEPVCCQRSRGSECCGDPDPEQVPCAKCETTGRVAAPPAAERDAEDAALKKAVEQCKRWAVNATNQWDRDNYERCAQAIEAIAARQGEGK